MALYNKRKKVHLIVYEGNFFPQNVRMVYIMVQEVNYNDVRIQSRVFVGNCQQDGWQLPTTWMITVNNIDGNCQQLKWQLSCMNRTRVFASSKMCSTIRTDSFCRTKYLTYRKKERACVSFLCKSLCILHIFRNFAHDLYGTGGKIRFTPYYI